MTTDDNETQGAFAGRMDARQAEAFSPVETGEGIAADELKQFIGRIERLEEEKATIGGDIKEVYAEAKGRGFDTKAIRKIVSLRKKEPSERQEEEAILDLYMQALGM